MANSHKLVLLCCLFGLVASALGQTKTAKCYECEYFALNAVSESNPEECKTNPPPEKYLKDCAFVGEGGVEPTDFQCVKVTGRVGIEDEEGNTENYDYVHRYCSPGKRFEVDCKNTKSFQIPGNEEYIKRGTMCVCEGDKCNSASMSSIGLVTLGLSLIFARFW